MTRISVAMATYNGSRYIGEQLESLSTQVHLPIELVVCDDGSSDCTVALVEEFQLTAPFPVRVFRNDENLGYSDNFLKAANLCTGDWIAFCDQDDVWLPNKLEAVAFVVESEEHVTLVLQSAMLCDADLIASGRLFPGKLRAGIYDANEQYGFWVWPGFLKTVRADWLQELDSEHRPLNYFPDHKLQSHDKWTCMVANALGGICVLDGAVALYRRHEAALTGYYQAKSTPKRISQARFVGSGHYRFLAEVARSSKAYLEKLVDEVSDVQWRVSFAQSAKCYERLASIQEHRADLYDADSFINRVSLFLRILHLRGYFGSNFTAMGLRSMLKDAVCTFFGSSLLSAYQ